MHREGEQRQLAELGKRPDGKGMKAAVFWQMTLIKIQRMPEVMQKVVMKADSEPVHWSAGLFFLPELSAF